eukprot:scaffold46031_cov27-Tisochrysis_lutea.AAC.2
MDGGRIWPVNPSPFSRAEFVESPSYKMTLSDESMISISEMEMRTLALETAGMILPSPSPNDPRDAVSVKLPPHPARMVWTSASGARSAPRPPNINAEKESVTATCPQRAAGMADIGIGLVQTSCPATAE